jgi:hypothetical protein
MNTDWNTVNNAYSNAILDADLLEDVLSDLGCDITAGDGERYRVACPVHEGDGRNMEITIGGDDLPVRWCCYSNSCHEMYKPSLIGLVRGVLSAQQGQTARMKEAVDFLRKYVGHLKLPQTARHARPRPDPKPTPLKLTREQVRHDSALAIPSKYYLSRGYSEAVLDEFDVGDSAKLKRAVVPLYDDEGTTCIGYAARSKWLECEACKMHHFGPDCGYGQCKWMLPKGFPSSRYLFNYARAKATDSPFIFLTEGVGDVLKLAMAGLVGVAILGSSPTEVHVRKLDALGKEVWVAFDNDEAGEDAEKRFRGKQEEVGIELRTISISAPEAYNDIGETPIPELYESVVEQLERELETDEVFGMGADVLQRSRDRLAGFRAWLETSGVPVRWRLQEGMATIR